jgi:hypothetical protein
MSARKKTRKNAGEGYGYMFHGAFGTKEKAQAKERKTKGAWVKGFFTKDGQHRYAVMSPRTNPIKHRRNPHASFWKNLSKAEQKFLKKLGFKAAEFKTQADVDHAKRTLAQMDATNRAYSSRENPHELLIMGANPHKGNDQDITVPPGSTITIRMNPTEVNPDRYTSAHAIARGIQKQAPGLIQTKKQKRVAGMVRGARRHRYEWIPPEGIAPGMNPGLTSLLDVASIGTSLPGLLKKTRKNVELGTYENGVFHPWTRRPKSRQKKAIHRQNPSAEVIREEFTGMPVEHEHVRQEPHMPAGNYAQLGKLLSLYVKPRAGGQVLEIKGDGKILVVSDESARQLWFVGGDQDVTDSLAQFGALEREPELFELGEARRIDYEQRKEHVAHPDQDHWRHNFGEETGELPRVLFDRRHKRLLLEGGAYEVRREGIVN